MLIAILSFLAGVAVGVLVMRKHAAKAAALESKGRSLLAALKGKDE
jgi:type II secretory pathway pseudopilin PulG